MMTRSLASVGRVVVWWCVSPARLGADRRLEEPGQPRRGWRRLVEDVLHEAAGEVAGGVCARRAAGDP